MNLATLSIEGSPIPLLDDVGYSPLFGYAQADLSQTGMLVYRKGSEGHQSVINWWGRRSETRPVRRSESEPPAGQLFYAD